MIGTTGVTTRAYFRTLRILHLALIMGQVVFAMMVFVIKLVSISETVSLTPELQDLLRYILPGLALLGTGLSWLLFSSRIKALKELTDPAAQYTGYRSACVLRYAILEAPSLIALVGFTLSNDYTFMAIPALIILVFILIRPTKAALISHLQPGYEQQLLLEDPAAVLYEEHTSSNT